MHWLILLGATSAAALLMYVDEFIAGVCMGAGVAYFGVVHAAHLKRKYGNDS